MGGGARCATLDGGADYSTLVRTVAGGHRPRNCRSGNRDTMGMDLAVFANALSSGVVQARIRCLD
jgi:hypothetical protein